MNGWDIESKSTSPSWISREREPASPTRQRATSEGDVELAASSLDDALRCWTGEPLSDVADFPFYDSAARQLREFRVGVVELRYAAYLSCHRDLEVLDDIDVWVRSDPWRERLRAQQMVALYRTGRQIDALAAYADLRRLLVTEFGVDPCDEVQQLYGRILRQDPSLLDGCGSGLPMSGSPASTPAWSGARTSATIRSSRSSGK